MKLFAVPLSCFRVGVTRIMWRAISLLVSTTFVELYYKSYNLTFMNLFLNKVTISFYPCILLEDVTKCAFHTKVNNFKTTTIKNKLVKKAC